MSMRRLVGGCGAFALSCLLIAAASSSQAQGPAAHPGASSALPAASSGGSASAPRAGQFAAQAASSVTLRWQPVARSSDRLTARQLGLVINEADPYSVAVGEYYARRRGLAPAQVLRVRLPLQGRLGVSEFDGLKRAIDAHFGPETQALALAWVTPFAVECQSITGVLALGFDAQLCSRTCQRDARSPYFNATTARPFTAFGWRPSMLIAAPSIDQARALIDRGIASDASLGLRGGLPVHAHFMVTTDAARTVRAPAFPPPGLLRVKQTQIHVEQGDVPDALLASSTTPNTAGHTPVLLVSTGVARLPPLRADGWAPGALADHLTSFGGVFDQDTGQSSALIWIASGATASYGAVSEPCNHPEKFPNPQMLLMHYLQGTTALEAYWKSVAWPRQGVFIGEPLAAPFAPRRVLP